jgi:hypothetical protein
MVGRKERRHHLALQWCQIVGHIGTLHHVVVGERCLMTFEAITTIRGMSSDLLGPLSAVRSVSGIDSRQAVQLEAIGFGLDAVDALYWRLVRSLNLQAQDLPLVFADAWAIVDWMHRLDGLVAGCRGLPQDAEAVVVFRSTSTLVENLRHIFQHPNETLRETSTTRRSLWGHLSWQISDNGVRFVAAITPFGRWEGGEFRRPADSHLPPRAPIDRVSLFSPDGNVEIGLTGQHDAAVRFAGQLDAAVEIADREPGEIMRLRHWLPGAG